MPHCTATLSQLNMDSVSKLALWSKDWNCTYLESDHYGTIQIRQVHSILQFGKRSCEFYMHIWKYRNRRAEVIRCGVLGIAHSGRLSFCDWAWHLKRGTRCCVTALLGETCVMFRQITCITYISLERRCVSSNLPCAGVWSGSDGLHLGIYAS